MSSSAKRPAAASADAAPAGKVARPAPPLVHPARVRPLRAGSTSNDGPVVYWMSRDQRVRDNWALLHAAQTANTSGRPLAVVFNLLPSFLGMTGQRHFGFMLRSLHLVSRDLEALGIPFFLLRGADPASTLPPLLSSLRASLLVTDFSPLREGRKWRTDVAAALSCPFDEVDAHNVVPVWSASPKLEYAARTMRPKITAQLPTFLTEFPPLPSVLPWPHAKPPPLDWAALIAEATAPTPGGVPEVSGFAPGEAAGAAALASFLSPSRLRLYAEKRNDPNVPQALSGLSPWLHFGQLSAQRCALAAQAVPGGGGKSVEGFLEELVVRRELSDNFCLHNPSYDSLAGASEWARASLELHASDARPVLHTRAELEAAQSKDLLWNAAQLEMVHTGKMHGAWWGGGGAAERAKAQGGHRQGDRVCFLMRVLTMRRMVSHVLGEEDSGVVGFARRGPRHRHLPQRQVQPGRAGPQRLRGLHVEHRGHPRHGLGGAPNLRKNSLHELCGRQAEVQCGRLRQPHRGRGEGHQGQGGRRRRRKSWSRRGRRLKAARRGSSIAETVARRDEACVCVVRKETS